MSSIEVFEERCIGAGNCADVAAKYFGLKDSDGTVVLLQGKVDQGDDALVDRAAGICPVGAIEIHHA